MGTLNILEGSVYGNSRINALIKKSLSIGEVLIYVSV